MIEAVENHMPEVIVIDEIGTEAEAAAAVLRAVEAATAQGIGTRPGQNTTDDITKAICAALEA